MHVPLLQRFQHIEATDLGLRGAQSTLVSEGGNTHVGHDRGYQHSMHKSVRRAVYKVWRSSCSGWMDAFEFHERIWPTRDATIPTSNSGMPEAGMAATCRCTTSSNISELGACRRCPHSLLNYRAFGPVKEFEKSIQLNFHTSQKEILNTST